MWHAIGLVSGGVTLVAFVVAVAAWVYRQQILQKEKLIRTAPEGERRDLVMAALEFFRIEPSMLTKQQQFDLAIAQIEARAKRFLIAAIIVAIVAGLSALGLVVAIVNAKDSTASRLLNAAEERALLEELGDEDSPPLLRQKALEKLEPLRGRDLSGCFFNQLRLAAKDFSGATLVDAHFVAADLKGANLTGVNAADAYFMNADLQDADLTKARLVRARFAGANLSGARLNEASFESARLAAEVGVERVGGVPVQVQRTPARLTRASMKGTLLHNADLTGLDLRGIDLRQVDGLTQAQVESAIMSESTKLPPDLSVGD